MDVTQEVGPRQWLDRYYFRPARADDEPYLRALGFRGLDLSSVILAHYRRPTAQPCAAFTLSRQYDEPGAWPDDAPSLYLSEPRMLRPFLPPGLRSAMWDYAGQRAVRLGITEVRGVAGPEFTRAVEWRAAGVEQVGTACVQGHQRALLRRIPGAPSEPEHAVDGINPVEDMHPYVEGNLADLMPSATKLTLVRENQRKRMGRPRAATSPGRGSQPRSSRKIRTAGVELRLATAEDVPQIQEMFHAAASDVASKYPELWDFWDRPRLPKYHLGQIERGELYVAYDRRKSTIPVGTIALLEAESSFWTNDLRRAIPPEVWEEIMKTPAMYFEGLISRTGIGTEILEGARRVALTKGKQQLRANVWTVGGLGDLYGKIKFEQMEEPGLPLPLPRRAGRALQRGTEEPFTSRIPRTPTRLAAAKTGVRSVTVYGPTGPNPPPAASKSALSAVRGRKPAV